jgi:hypothetical protein
MTDQNGSRIGYVTNKLPTLHQILTKPNTSGLDEEERTSVVDEGEDGTTMGSGAKTTSNLNNASNICTIHHISNMHHYL